MTESDLVVVVAAIVNALIVAAAQISTSRNIPKRELKADVVHYEKWYANRMAMYVRLGWFGLFFSFAVLFGGSLLRITAENAFGRDVAVTVVFYYFATFVALYVYVLLCFLFDCFRHP